MNTIMGARLRIAIYLSVMILSTLIVLRFFNFAGIMVWGVIVGACMLLMIANSDVIDRVIKRNAVSVNCDVNVVKRA